jgi:hypothetical protein
MLDDLKTVILKAISESTDVCMAMDANEAWTQRTFHEWIAECSLISVHKNVYDKEYYEMNKSQQPTRMAPAKSITFSVLPACLGA